MNRPTLHRRAARILLGSFLLLQLGGCTWIRTHVPASMGGITQDCADCRKTCETANDPIACRDACDSGACRKPDANR
jgi:hypothetical protein